MASQNATELKSVNEGARHWVAAQLSDATLHDGIAIPLRRLNAMAEVMCLAEEDSGPWREYGAAMKDGTGQAMDLAWECRTFAEGLADSAARRSVSPTGMISRCDKLLGLVYQLDSMAHVLRSVPDDEGPWQSYGERMSRYTSEAMEAVGFLWGVIGRLPGATDGGGLSESSLAAAAGPGAVKPIH